MNMDDNSTAERRGYLSKVPMAIGGFFLLLLIAECNVNIVGRYLRMPIAGSYDFLSLFGVFMVAACLIITELSEGHIMISMFTFGSSKRFLRTAHNTIVTLISIGAVLWLVWTIVHHIVKVSIPHNELAMTLEIPCAPFRIGWAIGWILLIVGLVKKLHNNLTGKRQR